MPDTKRIYSADGTFIDEPLNDSEQSDLDALRNSIAVQSTKEAAMIALVESDKFVRISVETQIPMSPASISYRAALRAIMNGNNAITLPQEPTS